MPHFDRPAVVRCLAAFTLLSIFPAGLAAHAEQKPWTEVKSPHFRVITDGSEKDARNVAAEFEQMRYVFAIRFPTFQLDSGAPLTIVAARDLDTAKQLEPQLWKRNENLAGEFHHGWEKQFAVIRMDTWGAGAHQVVYHEYTHSILHLNARWLPLWLDEGLAEFYAYTRFQSGKIYIGAPTERFGVLKQQSLMPVEQILDVRDALFNHDERRSQIFYADAWALVHYLIFGDGMQGGARLNQFFHLLQQGLPQKQAFTQVFGDYAQFDKAWFVYTNRFGFSAGVLPAQDHLDEKSFPARKLTVAETEYELGTFHIGARDRTIGATLIEAALRDDAQLAPAHEEEGFLLFGKGEDAEAAQEFAKAYALDATLYRSLFAEAMLSATSKATDPAAFRAQLNKVTELNPKFAPAWIELARLDMREHDYKAALINSRKAESLEPSRAGYHLLTGRILLARGQGGDAATFAKFVADRWLGPDHDEAVALWNQVPAAQRPGNVSLELQPFGTEHQDSATGTIEATHCGDAKTPFTIVLSEPTGKARTFSQQHGFPSGFADTLWYGADHFTLCHHLEGLPAVVFFRPGSTATGSADELTELEIRDDAPSVAAAPRVQAAQ